MTDFHTGRRVSPVTQPASQPGVSIPHPLHPHLPARRHTPSTSPIDGSPVKPHYCSPGIPHAIPHLLLPGRSPPSTLTRSLDDSLSRVSWPLVPPPSFPEPEPGIDPRDPPWLLAAASPFPDPDTETLVLSSPSHSSSSLSTELLAGVSLHHHGQRR